MSEELRVTKQSAQLTAEEVSLFSLQISMMLKAGILPVDGVGLLEAEGVSDREKKLLSTMREVLEQGMPFYEAMEATTSFPEHAVRMVRIGEETGRLEQVLTSLAQHYQQEHELRENMRQAVMYPAWLSVVIAVVTFVLITEVLPVFQQVLEQMGSGLSPWAASLTQMGIFSEWGSIVFTIVLLALAAFLYINTRSTAGQERLRRFVDILFFRGLLSLSVAREQFASAISMSLASGLNLNEAMDRAMMLVDDSKMKVKIEQCKQLLEEGETFSHAVERSAIFSGLEIGLISAGFRAGASESVMQELSKRCHGQTEDIMSKIMARIEPILIVVLVLVVGMLLLSVMLPLVAMMNSIGS